MKISICSLVTLLLTIAVLVAHPNAHADAHQKPPVQAADPAKPVTIQPPPEAVIAPAPIPLAQEDMQALSAVFATKAGLIRALAAIQKEIDANDADGQRAFLRAQAKHPDMPINTTTWTYSPAPKKDGGQ